MPYYRVRKHARPLGDDFTAYSPRDMALQYLNHPDQFARTTARLRYGDIYVNQHKSPFSFDVWDNICDVPHWDTFKFSDLFYEDHTPIDHL